MYYVYALHSLKDKKLYIDYSKNLKTRIRHHQSGKVKSTKNRRPLRLIYYEAYFIEKDAKKRETFLKGGSGHKYLYKQLKHYFDLNKTEAKSSL